MWNPMLGLFSHVQVGVFMESYFDEVVVEGSHSPVTLHSILALLLPVNGQVFEGTYPDFSFSR